MFWLKQMSTSLCVRFKAQVIDELLTISGAVAPDAVDNWKRMNVNVSILTSARLGRLAAIRFLTSGHTSRKYGS
jgi:hypothetical protein